MTAEEQAKLTPKQLMDEIKRALYPKVASGELMNWEQLADAMHNEIRDYYITNYQSSLKEAIEKRKYSLECYLDAIIEGSVERAKTRASISECVTFLEAIKTVTPKK